MHFASRGNIAIASSYRIYHTYHTIAVIACGTLCYNVFTVLIGFVLTKSYQSYRVRTPEQPQHRYVWSYPCTLPPQQQQKRRSKKKQEIHLHIHTTNNREEFHITRDETSLYENADFSRDTIMSSIKDGELKTNEILQHIGQGIAYAKIKTDKVDARTLADLLRLYGTRVLHI